MKMNNIIEIIETKLQAQKDTILFKDLQIENLKKQLEAAQKELAEAKGAKQ